MWRPGSYESNVDSFLEPQRHITTGATLRIRLSDKTSRLRPRHVALQTSQTNET